MYDSRIWCRRAVIVRSDRRRSPVNRSCLTILDPTQAIAVLPQSSRQFGNERTHRNVGTHGLSGQVSPDLRRDGERFLHIVSVNLNVDWVILRATAGIVAAPAGVAKPMRVTSRGGRSKIGTRGTIS
jgi:hypothetical protein